MDFLYSFFISFIMIFVSELGDKTQLLVLSFSNKLRASRILIGIALGTFFSHGFAILFGSFVSSISSDFSSYLSFFTYLSFLIFGVYGFLPKNDSNDHSKSSFLSKLSCLRISYIFIIAFSIFIGEIGDKTFLASLGLGIEYSDYKFSLIFGSVLGMLCSNSIAIFFGRFLGNNFNSDFVEKLSNVLFILFGIFGFLNFFIHNC